MILKKQHNFIAILNNFSYRKKTEICSLEKYLKIVNF